MYKHLGDLLSDIYHKMGRVDRTSVSDGTLVAEIRSNRFCLFIIPCADSLGKKMLFAFALKPVFRREEYSPPRQYHC